MKPIASMAVVVNPHKTGVMELSRDITQEAEKMGVSCAILSDYPIKPHALDVFDVCCVIGGDGTILGAVPEAVRSSTPILGVNLGKLGFLATYTPEGIIERLPQVIEGQYCIDERTLIRCGQEGETPLIALNDVVIKSTSINLMHLQVFQNCKRVADYHCDGLIFATPTGSTAYNLSAGGPILHPQNHSIAMTPICPHTLSNRSFIFPDSVELRVECDCAVYKPSLSIDGRAYPGDDPVFPFHISVSPEKIRLIHDSEYSHYQMLRTKLNWV